jgi:hypothetical protein
MKKDKGRIQGQFVPLLHEMMDCPAYIALSPSAKCLYLALKRRVARNNNRAYLSYRMARRELGAGFNKVKEWFAELEHYGFIALAAHHSLGVDGKGKAPLWRLTELGHVAGAGTEFPSKEYLRWDGVLFDSKPYRYSAKWKKQNPVLRAENTPLSASRTPVLSASVAPETTSALCGGDIENEPTALREGDISSLTTGGPISGLSYLKQVSKPSLVEFGPNDPRIIALVRTKKRLNARRSHNGKRG